MWEDREKSCNEQRTRRLATQSCDGQHAAGPTFPPSRRRDHDGPIVGWLEKPEPTSGQKRPPRDRSVARVQGQQPEQHKAECCQEQSERGEN